MSTRNHSNEHITTRREFLGRSAAIVAGLLLLEEGVQAEPRTPLLIGSGEHTYEVLHDWLTLPSDILFGDTQGIAQDAAGRIYISRTVHSASVKKDAIVVFDKDGKFLNSWGERFAGGGHGLDIRREGQAEFLIRGEEMLIPDLKSVVTIVDKDNKVVVQLGDGDPSALRNHPRQDFLPGKFVHPHGAKYLHNSDILVAEWVPIGRVTLLKKRSA